MPSLFSNTPAASHTPASPNIPAVLPALSASQQKNPLSPQHSSLLVSSSPPSLQSYSSHTSPHVLTNKVATEPKQLPILSESRPGSPPKHKKSTATLAPLEKSETLVAPLKNADPDHTKPLSLISQNRRDAQTEWNDLVLQLRQEARPNLKKQIDALRNLLVLLEEDLLGSLVNQVSFSKEECPGTSNSPSLPQNSIADEAVKKLKKSNHTAKKSIIAELEKTLAQAKKITELMPPKISVFERLIGLESQYFENQKDDINSLMKKSTLKKENLQQNLQPTPKDINNIGVSENLKEIESLEKALQDSLSQYEKITYQLKNLNERHLALHRHIYQQDEKFNKTIERSLESIKILPASSQKNTNIVHNNLYSPTENLKVMGMNAKNLLKNIDTLNTELNKLIKSKEAWERERTSIMESKNYLYKAEDAERTHQANMFHSYQTILKI